MKFSPSLGYFMKPQSRNGFNLIAPLILTFSHQGRRDFCFLSLEGRGLR
jgi:hypothetical protein